LRLSAGNSIVLNFSGRCPFDPGIRRMACISISNELVASEETYLPQLGE
jgi:hypothetical protein